MIEGFRVPITVQLEPKVHAAFLRLAEQQGERLERVLAKHLAAHAPARAPRGYTRMTPQLLEQAKALLEEGFTPRTVAARIGVSPQTIRNHLTPKGLNHDRTQAEADRAAQLDR